MKPPNTRLTAAKGITKITDMMNVKNNKNSKSPSNTPTMGAHIDGNRNVNDGKQKVLPTADSDVKDLLTQLLSRMDALTGEVKELRKENKALRDTVDEMRALREEIDVRALTWDTNIIELKERIAFMEQQEEAREKKDKLKNIVISGLETKDQNISQQVEFFIENELQVVCGVKEASVSTKEGRPDLIFVELCPLEDKRKIMANKSKLKGTRIFINHAETTKDKEEAAKRKNTRIGYRKLLIDGIQYMWDNEKGLIQLFRSPGRRGRRPFTTAEGNHSPNQQ